MSKSYREGIDMVVAQMLRTENAIDTAIADLGRLITTLADARVESSMPVRAGQNEMQHALHAVSHAVEMRARIVKAHRNGFTTARFLGVTENFGGGFGTPSMASLEEQAFKKDDAPKLAAVA